MTWRFRTAGASKSLLLVGLAATLASCSNGRNDGPVTVDAIGLPEQIINPLRDSNAPAAKITLGATAQGLLSFDASGQVVDALAESWIVEDGGQSYIFRLKRLTWADGKPVKADVVARLLRERLRANPTWLAGLDPEIRAMTDRVIEIRIGAALPAFLQLLAQPQFAILSRDGGTGPYRPTRTADRLDLAPMSAADVVAGPAEPSDIPPAERRRLEASSGARALVRFRERRTDLILGGRFQHLLLVPAAELSMNDLRVDPVSGIFGLAITGKSSFLADGNVRDALSRVVDRTALAGTLGLPGWQTATQLLPQQLELDRAPSVPVWSNSPMATRIAIARQAVARWVAANGDAPLLKIALPDGAGATVLFFRLAQDFAQLGVRLDRVAAGTPADLTLIDEVAPFDSALWYLSRLDCSAGVICDSQASMLLASARQADSEPEQARLLGEAERLITGYASYIPLGQPIRWSLVNKRLTGFQPSQRGVHPLNKLIATPN